MLRRVLLPVGILVAAGLLAGCVSPPENVECRASKEGHWISWDPVENATHYKVYRALNEEDEPILIDRTYDTSYLDTNVTQGTTYFYWVSAVGEMPEDAPEELLGVLEEESGEPVENESLPSEVCELTAVPFFPSAVAGVLATAGIVGAYVVMRRRKP